MRARERGVSSRTAAGAVVVTTVVALLAYVSLRPAPAAPLIAFNADAYTAETQALLTGFTNAGGIPVAPPHPDGSFALARQIVSGSRVDVFIPVSLSAAARSNLGDLSENWAIGIASDQMVIAYSSAAMSSPGGEAIVREFQGAAVSNSTSDWNAAFQGLTSGSVRVGISDPNADPAGFRGWLVLEAAGVYYGSGNPAAYASRLLGTRANVTGSAAANMVAPLEADQLQFLFVYRSVAIAQHLAYLQLDHRINLGDPRLAASYAQLTYRLAAGVAKGAPIILCVTIPANAPHASEARQFVQYVAKNSGGVLSAYGLQAFAPPLLYNDTTAPQFVSQMLSQGVVGRGGSLGP